MLNGYIITSLLIALAFIVLGLITLTRNSKSNQNRYFFFYSFSLAIWLVSNYIAGDPGVPDQLALIANKAVFLFGGLAILFLLFFIKSLIQKRFTRLEKAAVISYFLMLAASITPFIVSDVFVQNNTYAIEFGTLSGPYFLLLLAVLYFSILNLVQARKRSTGILRSQLDVVYFSFATGILAIIITNALLPFVFSYYRLTQIGSFFSVFFVVGLAYAIIRHKLFDIRLIFARTAAYALSWLVLTLAYVVVLVNSASLLFGTEIEVNVELFTYIFIGLALVTGLLPIKKYFDKVTNRLFYRDAYDSQELIEKLNKNIVSNVDLESMLKKSTGIIENNIKADYCVFGLKETAYMPQRIIGNKSKVFEDDDIAVARAITPHIHNRVIVTDELEQDRQQLKDVLQKNNIAVICRLTTTLKYEVEGVGYLVLGPKKSGSPYTSQDIKVLKIIANEMVIAIQNSLRYEEIEKFNATLQEKVDTATRQLRKTNEKLKALDETKDEFISMASHQLRTPLTSVKGYLSMVLEEDAGEINDTQRKFLDQAFVSSQRMTYLIADLLNVSRLRTGKFVIDSVPTDLSEVIRTEVEQLTETAEARHLKLSFNKPDDMPQLMLDETKIRQVIMNFIDNAIYYTPSGGNIKVGLEDTGESIEFTVVDDGIGVPKTQQLHLFNKFFRAENAKKARPDGTGLGLFMAKKVVVAQGGSIIFRSQEGKGSTFGFSFAKVKVAVPSNAIPDGEAKKEEPAAAAA